MYLYECGLTEKGQTPFMKISKKRDDEDENNKERTIPTEQSSHKSERPIHPPIEIEELHKLGENRS